MSSVPILIYCSKTGNTKTFVEYIANKVDIWVADGFNVDITNYDKIILGSYTWGNGKIPTEMKDFLIKNKDNFKGKRVYVFGSGYSIYPKFCGAVDGIIKIMTDCDADVQWCFKFEKRFNKDDFYEWELNDMIEKLIG
jgi:flavodoxin I